MSSHKNHTKTETNTSTPTSSTQDQISTLKTINGWTYRVITPTSSLYDFLPKPDNTALKKTKSLWCPFTSTCKRKGTGRKPCLSQQEKKPTPTSKQTFQKEYVLNYSNIQKCLGETYRTRIEEYTPRYTTFIDLPHELQTYEPATGDRPKTIVLLGAAKLGKTEWARCHGKHIYSEEQSSTTTSSINEREQPTVSSMTSGLGNLHI